MLIELLVKCFCLGFILVKLEVLYEEYVYANSTFVNEQRGVVEVME